MEGYQNWTFPLAIYGCQDTFSRKILFLKVWSSNNDPMVTASFFMTHLFEHNVVPRFIRLDCGTETGIIGALQAYLRRNDAELNDPTDSVMFGPSTSNKIERFWRDLHERMEGVIKRL